MQEYQWFSISSTMQIHNNQQKGHMVIQAQKNASI